MKAQNTNLLSQIKFSDPKVYGTAAVLGLSLLYLGKQYFSGGVCTKTADLTGKVVIITGANTGIGKETARALASMGATIVLACRDLKRSIPAVEELKSSTKNQNIELIRLDLSDLESVRTFVKEFKQKYQRLDILINNAGIMMLPKRTETKDGFEAQFGTNHLGHFLLTNLLVDLLKASAPSRIINVSSRANIRGHIDIDDLMLAQKYSPMKAYSQSKLANVLFSRILNQKLEGSGVKAVSLHPGVVRTELSRYMTEAWYMKLLHLSLTPLLFYIGKNSEQGAQTSIYCAVCDHKELKGGEYYSDCKTKKPNPEGENDDVAKALWEKSEGLVKQKFNI